MTVKLGEVFDQENLKQSSTRKETVVVWPLYVGWFAGVTAPPTVERVGPVLHVLVTPATSNSEDS